MRDKGFIKMNFDIVKINDRQLQGDSFSVFDQDNVALLSAMVFGKTPTFLKVKKRLESRNSTC